MRRNYKQNLDNQLNEKQFMKAQENQSRVRQQEEFKKVTFTPQEVNKYERDRQLLQMTKYK